MIAAVRRPPLERNLPVYVAVRAISGFFIWAPIWMLYLLETRGLSLGAVAGLEAALVACALIGEIPAGAVADRWGRRASLLLGSAVYTAGALAFGLTGDYLLLLAAWALMGAGLALWSGAGPALLYDTLRALGREPEFERRLGRAEAAGQIAELAAVAAAGPAAYLAGYQGVVLINCAAMAGAGAAALLLREAPRGRADAGAPSAPGYLAALRAGLALALRGRALFYLIVLSALIWALLRVAEWARPLFLRDHGRLPESGLLDGLAYSAWFAPLLAGSAAGALLAAPLAARLGEGRALPAVGLAGAAALAVMAALDHVAAIAAFALAAACVSAAWTLAVGSVNRRVPSAQRATVLSVLAFAGALLMFSRVLLIGPFAGAVGLRPAFALGLALLAALGLPLWLLWRRAEAAPTRRPSANCDTRH